MVSEVGMALVSGRVVHRKPATNAAPSHHGVRKQHVNMVLRGQKLDYLLSYPKTDPKLFPGLLLRQVHQVHALFKLNSLGPKNVTYC